MKNDNSTKQSNASKPMLAKRLLKFRFWGNFGELNEEEDICEMEMLYGDKFCFFESEPINDLFACRNFQVMQFTGLKDINNKEIYEGDIIKGKTFSGKENISYVIYDNNYGCWQLQTVDNKPLSFPIKSFNKELEIIGNIFENVNLLPNVI